MSTELRHKHEDELEWGELLPRHWRVRKLKHVCEVFPSNVDKKTYENDPPVLLCNYTDVYYNEKITLELPFIEATATPEQINRFGLRAGDTIITKDSETADDIAVAAYVPEDLPGVVCGYHLAMVRPYKGMSGAFIKWFFCSRTLKASVRVRANGLTRVGLGQYHLDNLIVPVPPLPEQTAIAAFLDRETGKIDALVEDQKRLIELLKEKRQAVISQAVTKGLDLNVPMKPSGVEWLGDVPEHWAVRPLRYSIASITSGTSVNAIDEPALPGEAGVLKTSCVYRGRFDPAENKAVLPEELGRVSCPVVPDTIVVSRMNTPDLVGAAGLVTEETPDIYLPDRLWQVRLRVGHAAYHHYWMQSASYRVQVRLACAGTSSSMQNLSQDDFQGFVLAVPPNSEQQAIARYLDATLAKSDNLVDHAEKAVRLLQERRAALISGAVTGKIDVRAARDAEEMVA